VVVASLPFLGTVMKQLADPLRAAVKAKIEKDCTQASEAEVRALVLPVLRKRSVAAE
jgi:protein required for attachment to host cells